MINLNSKAYSLDTLEVVNVDGLICVRKTFENNISRVRKNIQKQKDFKLIDTGVLKITAAEVIDFNYEDNHATMLMPYINGINAETFPVFVSQDIANAWSVALSTLIYAELGNSRMMDIPTSIFQEKLSSVQENIKNRTSLDGSLQEVSQFIRAMPASLPFPIGPCHGDLTLSNMILNTAKGLVLIDFLDTYLESPLQDIVKLEQDFTYRWSFRYSDSSTQIKAGILCRHFRPSVIDSLTALYPQQIKILMLMTLVRIIPYVRDAITEEWLKVSLEHCLKH